MEDDTFQIEQQCHGYRGGHQLLGSSVKLSREDQDTIDRLSDISGSLRPDERFAPYLTLYPLPSGTYYVIARTWQDLNARRAGCVLTRSFLIRANDWVYFEGVLALVDLLRPVDRDDLAVEALRFRENTNKEIPEVPVAQTLEIVEALFLEERQPIVVFGATDPDIIIVRLVTALWPGLKRLFSACSFALSPRTVIGKSFDLAFSPKEARSRFANWEGRRVDGAGVRDPVARHRWSLATARIIFMDPKPSLTKLDALGVLARDSDGDGARLRLSLLWNDLLDQLRVSPNAVLGMLDILRSQAGELQYNIAGAVSSAVEKAESLSVSKRLEFLVPLCSKLANTEIPIHLGIQLQTAVKTVVSINPRLAISALSSIAPDDHLTTRLFFAGIADGILTAPDEFLQYRLYDLFDDVRLRRLLSSNKKFPDELIGKVPGNGDLTWIKRLSELVESQYRALSHDELARIIHNLNTDQQAPLLKSYLRVTEGANLIDDAKVLWETTRFDCKAFDEPLVESARSRDRLLELRQLLGSLPNSASNERLLYSSLAGAAEDLAWVASAITLPVVKRSQMMSFVLDRCDDAALAQIARSSDLMGKVISVFAFKEAVQPQAQIYLKLLSWTQFDIDRVLPVATTVLRTYSGHDKTSALQAFVAKGLRFASPTRNEEIRELLCDPHLDIDPDALIQSAVSEESSPRRISDNIAILNLTSQPMRNEILRFVDNLSFRLDQSHPEKLTESGISAWAAIIQAAGEINPIGQLRAADVALSFAFANPSRGVSPLIVVSFPLIYRELRHGHETPSLWSKLFSDWDRCKTMRKELVSTFTKSNLPKADFLRSAFASGDLEKIIARLLKEERGSEYLLAISHEMKQFRPDERKALEELLESFVSNAASSKKDGLSHS